MSTMKQYATYVDDSRNWYRGAVFYSDGKRVWHTSCAHRHRTYKAAQECADKMERQLQNEQKNPDGLTPKQSLKKHVEEHHNKLWFSKPVSRMALEELQDAHAEEHYRREWASGHTHWDGTDDDRNFGPSRRPSGWRTGADTRERR